MVFHSDQEAREKFETEIAMLKFVSRDRNIVQFYGAGVRLSDPHAQGKVEPRLWLITEYMEVRCLLSRHTLESQGSQVPRACFAVGLGSGAGPYSTAVSSWCHAARCSPCTWGSVQAATDLRAHLTWCGWAACHSLSCAAGRRRAASGPCC